jgi:hypothetical protein
MRSNTDTELTTNSGSWPGLHKSSRQGRFVRTDTDDGKRTRLGRSDLHILSERSGFMPDRADDKGEKLAGTPQAVWARQIHADTALTTRGRVAGTP